MRAGARPAAAHEGLIALIRDLVEEALDGRLPVMGTVTGVDGDGRPTVHVDDEEDARTIPFPRKAGQGYERGDRVLLSPNRAGEYVVTGGIESGRSGRRVRGEHLATKEIGREHVADGAIGNPQVEPGTLAGDRLRDGAVDTRQLSGNAVTGDKLASGAVDTGHLRDDAVTGGKLAANAVDTGNIRERAVTKGKLAETYAPETHAHDQYARKTDLEPYAKKSALDAYAKLTDLDRYAKRTDLGAYAKRGRYAVKDNAGKTIGTVEL
ncbi:MAG: hypothetical protein ACKOWF_01955 [Chloroflexota bacterium]